MNVAKPLSVCKRFVHIDKAFFWSQHISAASAEKNKKLVGQRVFDENSTDMTYTFDRSCKSYMRVWTYRTVFVM